MVAAGCPLLPRASAQSKPPVAPAPVPVVAPVARPASAVRGVNILIVALDDATTVAIDVPVLNAPPLTGTVPNALPIVPDVPLTAITPTRFNGLRPEWRAFAKKKEEKPDPRFLPLPEPPSRAPILSGGSTYATPAPIPRLPNGTDTNVTTIPAPLPLVPARPVAPAGRALLAALPLARALNGLGYTDVQATGPDGSLIARALGERRLSPGTVATLREALMSLQGATKLPTGLRKATIDVSTKRATDAAAAIGQATGYRAVVALYVSPFADGASPYAVVLSDSVSETGEPLLWSETSADEVSARDTGATTGAALLDKSLDKWSPAGPTAMRALADSHLDKARAAGVAGNLNLARDEITRAIALDATRADAYVLLGDLLAPTDLTGAAVAYKRAVDLNSKDGATYEKIAIAYANTPVPDWPRALEAGKKALAAGVDTANLRIAMARAQFGRADLFRGGDRVYKAEDAEAEAQIHLDRALQLSPDNPDALRLLARALISSGRMTEAVQTLDRVIPLFPKDIDLQRQYAQSLMSLGDRKEDTFVAYSKLWKLSATSLPSVDSISYSALIEGFDEHVFNLGKSARLLSDGVATGSIARESAFLQLSRLKADMGDAEDTITTLQVPAGFSTTAATARQFAATLMDQALEAHQTFLDTGQVLYRSRAAELYRQAVAQLNVARNAK
ncbi:hypothetical protein IAD21_03263 [Abditibacteriota bacterium]|nr:hypothetical protein IAD21_03263 [Abditibacteriota bacterium]